MNILKILPRGGRKPFLSHISVKKKSKPSDKQVAMFGTYKTMSLLDLIKESGRLRRVMYGKMMAEQRKTELTKIQPAETKD